MSRAARLTKADVSRMIAGAVAAGIPIERITGVKYSDCVLEVLFAEPIKSSDARAENEWDAVLK
ncbi:hypothetical protein AB7G19_02295 [Bradyrhizobium sp. 215_C5_N1_1]|uniref:hypothetical protein n=1 Tax=unclassified Bradyrhizobium TaxID=2631580 RepID=UPI003F8B057E